MLDLRGARSYDWANSAGIDIFMEPAVTDTETEGSPDPAGTLTIRTAAMPADTNPAGDIFGGWVMSQMDIAGGIAAGEVARSRVVTAAVEAMSFIAPVKVGDVLCVYTSATHIGHTSITIKIEAFVRRRGLDDRIKVTSGHFVYVALDEAGRKRPVRS